jgi:hypothetical protein
MLGMQGGRQTPLTQVVEQLVFNDREMAGEALPQARQVDPGK